MRLLAALAVAVAVGAFVAGATGATLGRPARPRWLHMPAVLRVGESQGTSPLRLAGASATAATVTWLLVAAFTGSTLVAAVPAAAIAVAPAGYLRTQTERLRRERLAAWPDALRSVVSALHAGQSLHQALLELARTGPVPLREVWLRYQRLTDHGLPEVRALEAVRQELADPLSDRVCEVLTIATTKGSRIAVRVLGDIADATAADVQLDERLKTAGVETRLNARAVFALPWLTLIVLCGRPGQFRDYYASGAGARVLLLSAAMSAGGMLVVRRLVTMPAEPRVLLDHQPEAPR